MKSVQKQNEHFEIIMYIFDNIKHTILLGKRKVTDSMFLLLLLLANVREG